jgi:hypothetical protein
MLRWMARARDLAGRIRPLHRCPCPPASRAAWGWCRRTSGRWRRPSPAQGCSGGERASLGGSSVVAAARCPSPSCAAPALTLPLSRCPPAPSPASNHHAPSHQPHHHAPSHQPHHHAPSPASPTTMRPATSTTTMRPATSTTHREDGPLGPRLDQHRPLAPKHAAARLVADGVEVVVQAAAAAPVALGVLPAVDLAQGPDGGACGEAMAWEAAGGVELGGASREAASRACWARRRRWLAGAPGVRGPSPRRPPVKRR